jgi:cold shock CspA family protein
MFGTVIKYDRLKTFGFILPDDPSLPDFFVCPKFITANKSRRFLMPGWRVEFTPVDIDGKPQAHDVRVLSTTIAVQLSEPMSKLETRS